VQASDTERTREPQKQRDDAEMFTVQQLKAMEQPSWNDSRLDDLNKRVEGGFERMDVEFRSRRGEMCRGFERVDEEFKAVRGEMSADFDRLFWKLVSTGLSVAAAAFALAGFL
jgi:hypothetical protein